MVVHSNWVFEQLSKCFRAKPPSVKSGGGFFLGVAFYLIYSVRISPNIRRRCGKTKGVNFEAGDQVN